MDTVSVFFTRNIVYVYFLYGLAFFSMGLVVLLESGRASEFRFARALRPLAAFGFVHGGHEWFEMFQIFAAHEGGRAAGMPEELVRVGSLVASFVFLLAFGTRLLPGAEVRPAASVWQVLGFVVVWLASVSVIYLRFRPPLADLVSAADVLARYSLGIPGALLACWALLRERHDFHLRGMSAYGQDLLWAALAFFIYGVIGQLFTRPSLVFPSQTINTAFFLRTFGLPVQLLRGVAAAAIVFTLGRALRAFEAESRVRLARANKARLEAQADTLKAQAVALEAQERRANEVEALNVQLKTTARELSAMVELSRILTSTIDLNRLLHDALYQIVYSFARGRYAAVFLKRPDGVLELAGEYRRPNATLPRPMQPIGPLVERAVVSEKLVGMGADGSIREVNGGNLVSGTGYPLLAVPLIFKGQVSGGLSLSSLDADGVLGRDEAHLLHAFAQQVAAALENARLYGVVQQREGQLEGMVRQLVNAQERERQRIAQELHDETGQKLTALAMGLAAAETQLGAADVKRASGTVRNLRDLADQSITELRHVMADLRPSQLDDLGLVPALRWYVQQYGARHSDLAVSFTADRLASRLPPQHETVLFRVVQEALTNIVRHARATAVRVELRQAPQKVCLEVADDGIGFDVSAPPRHADGSGLGLAGMRERVALVDGQIVVTSQLGQGTLIRVELPVR